MGDGVGLPTDGNCQHLPSQSRQKARGRVAHEVAVLQQLAQRSSRAHAQELLGQCALQKREAGVRELPHIRLAVGAPILDP